MLPLTASKRQSMGQAGAQQALAERLYVPFARYQPMMLAGGSLQRLGSLKKVGGEDVRTGQHVLVITLQMRHHPAQTFRVLSGCNLSCLDGLYRFSVVPNKAAHLRKQSI